MEEDEIKLTNSKKKKSLFADLRDASKSPFSMAKEEETVKEEVKKQAERVRETIQEYPEDAKENEFDWFDNFVDRRKRRRMKRPTILKNFLLKKGY